MCSLSAALNLFVVSILAIDWLVELCSVRTFSEEHNSVQTVNDWLIQWIQWIGNISLSLLVKHPLWSCRLIITSTEGLTTDVVAYAATDVVAYAAAWIEQRERSHPFWLVWTLWGLFTWNVENWVWHLRDLVLPDWSPTSGVLECSVWGVIGGVLTTMPRFVHT